MPPAQAPVFEALIVPYRSLSVKGLGIVVGAFVLLSAAVALWFWRWGAWPVVAFSFVEIPLLVLMLAINQRWARASELIMLDSAYLTVIRTDAAGRRKQDTLPAAWLRVDLDLADKIPRLVLSSHGRRCEVGAFLHEPDKVSLFDALRASLHNARNPQFDNPQLRGD
jgi:uncharacterized membrane protein